MTCLEANSWGGMSANCGSGVAALVRCCTTHHFEWLRCSVPEVSWTVYLYVRAVPGCCRQRSFLYLYDNRKKCLFALRLSSLPATLKGNIPLCSYNQRKVANQEKGRTTICLGGRLQEVMYGRTRQDYACVRRFTAGGICMRTVGHRCDGGQRRAFRTNRAPRWGDWEEVRRGSPAQYR